MKISKKSEKEILEVYNAYWDGYLKGNVKSMASLLDDDYTQIGSAEGEVFFNKKAAVKFLRDTIDQVAGKVDMRNRVIKLEPNTANILVTELTDLYVLIEGEWAFHSRFRASTMMQNKRSGWKIIHQHSSFPDIRAQEGENISIEKISLENLQLRDAVKRRTVELEQKRQELEVEASLERVRAQAMGMRKSEELATVSEIIFKELKSLGFAALRNTEIIINKDSKNSITSYYYSDYGVTGTIEVDYTTHPTVKNWMEDLKKTRDSFVAVRIAEKEMKAWRKYRESLGYLPDPKLNKVKTVEYYSYSIGLGALSVSSFKPISDEQIKTLGRFKNVFGLAYRRYADVVQAEAQAREARIEAALERVRARTMAMQRSDELGNVAEILFKQVQELGIHAWSTGFNIWQEGNDAYIDWVTNPSGGFMEPYTVDLTTHRVFREISDAKKRGEDFHVFDTSGESLQETYALLKSFAPKQFGGILASGISFPTRQINHYVYGAEVGLMFITPEACPEAHDIFKRFGKVFEQTYTRFNDLKQAEAQAHEARIEIALERVRSRTLAMHNSDELAETAAILIRQLNVLGIEPISLYIGIIQDESGSIEVWSTDANGNEIEKRYKSNIQENSSIRRIYEAWSNKEKVFILDLKGQELEDWLNYWRRLQFDFEPGPVLDRRVQSLAFFSNGFIAVTSPHELPEATIQLLERFALVFNLTFTRFLDLQKAEAQAREALIESSLERVRSKTMAMHNSQDVGNTVATMFEELVKLGVETNRCGILIFSETTNTEVWTAKSSGEGTATLIVGRLDVNIHRMLLGVRNAWKDKETFFTYTLAGDDIRKYYEAINNHPDYPTQFDLSSLPVQEIHSDFFFTEGAIFAFSAEPMRLESATIFKRFAGVFGQTYRRFLDLQKAEAQAREATIEASLEKVRGRAMAMHNTSDLTSTAGVVFTELRKLGINPIRSGVGLLDKVTGMAKLYAAMATAEDMNLSLAGTVDMNSHPFLIQQMEAWAKNENLSAVLSGPDLKSYYEAVYGQISVPVPSARDFQQEEYSYYFPFSAGLFFVWTEKPYSENEKAILIRFKSIVDLTFRRYLDLQRAEAQARQAQIEAAMEKVRSRSSAMQRPEELVEVAEVLRKEMGMLGVEELETSSIYIPDEATGTTECWYAIKDIRDDHKKLLSDHMTIRLNETWVGSQMMDFYTSQRDQTSIIMQGENRKEWINYCAQHSVVLQQGYYGDVIPERTYHLLKFSNGYMGAASPGKISAESWDLLKRATAVFSFAYTRFLDLQKAETQAREARIELALERVRARTMAMHKSEELSDVITVISEQLSQLKFKFDNVSFGINSASDDFDYWLSVPGRPRPYLFNVPYVSGPMMDSALEARSKNLTFYQSVLTPEESNQWHAHVLKHNPDLLPAEDRDYFLNKGFARSISITPNIMLAIGNYASKPYTEEENKIIKRFAAVFDQSYTRFLDLQKAEAQAREATIEAALERMRAQAMIMRKPEELIGICEVHFQELVKLGFQEMRNTQVIINNDEKQSFLNYDYSDYGVTGITEVKYEERFDNWIPSSAYDPSMASKVGDSFKVTEYVGKTLEDFRATRLKAGYLPDPKLDKANSVFYYYYSIGPGSIGVSTFRALSNEQLDLLNRFRNVFALAYRRYADIARAEAQAHEALIEASLERVRASAMAMHSSEDVVNATGVLFKELHKLGIETMRCGILIIDEDRTMEVWSVTNMDDGKTVRGSGRFNMDDHPLWIGLFSNWKQKEEFYYYHLAGEDKHAYYKVLENTPKYFSAPVRELPDQNFQGYNFQEGTIWTFSLHPHSVEDQQILKRFTAVFSLTFRRYQDLKKAEAQSREAKIETSLERVRASAMAMHTSEEVVAATSVLFVELHRLGIETVRCGILIISEARTMEVWTAAADKEGHPMKIIGVLDMTIHPLLMGLYTSWKQNLDFYEYRLTGLDKRLYYETLAALPTYSAFSQYINAPDHTLNFFMFAEGGVYTFSENPFSEETKAVLKKFTAVFSLTFRRYEDLKRAEGLAREATIEAALEKVRGKAMAMHTSNDLIATASIVFTELRRLGINSFRSGVGILTKESRHSKLYSAGDSLSLVGGVLLTDHPVLSEIYDSWISGKDYFPILKGDLLRTYYEKLRSDFTLPPEHAKDFEQHGYFLPFSEGTFYGWSERPYTEYEIKVLHRFKTIIDLTFRRYIELQTSEANALDAVRRASLDRVRAETASMRTTTDLERITPLIWNELTTLGVPFVRCGVFIMDEREEQIHTFLSTPDGKAIASFNTPFSSPTGLTEALPHWRKKEMYRTHWDEAAFAAQAKALMDQGAISSPDKYLTENRPTSLDLHFLPFLQGMLYVGNTSPLSDEQLGLVQNLADAFSTAYARYEDFNKLESAKGQIEKTLTDLKQTQAQLVQSEKMASLGELTAGIAHEIQNPLNFVNNFSEVNKELLEEMKAEIEKGNFNEVKVLAKDIIENEEKINHHGRRADGIVKGMLQHSRSSSGQKEPTDINALADEYLRLAYHGLRAKDKSFNAKFETKFDESIGKVPVIPQDIGRVVLNLITNAFYAVTEKKKTGIATYEPTVAVSTRKEGNHVLISVRDNGNGIPQKVLDKIFQPFFTTKPTGQGTGLGLSLSYDIVRAHGGELKVETLPAGQAGKDGEGAEFTVVLPV